MRNRLQRINALDTFAAIATMMVTACASGNTTKLAATWHEPNAGPIHFQKTLVAFVTKDETLRRSVEDKLAARVPNSVPAYRVLASSTAADSAAVRRQIRELGFDGAVVMRVVDVDSQVSYASGAYWYGAPSGFYRYWGNSWDYSYDPGYVVDVDKIVSVETQVYSLSHNALIWAGRSETTNPKSAGKLADAVIDRVIDAMHKDGLLAQALCSEHLCASAIAH
ncbi:MAG TPA: hypothetical protein VGM50_09040 [Gemmatimonadaceae bacterium]